MVKHPAYKRIKNYILDNIHNGNWQINQSIPTEIQLASEFNVSRMTVNRALKELSEEGVLERRQGAGTYIKQQQFKDTYVEVRNIAEDIRSSGKKYRAKVIKQGICQADFTLAQQFNCEVGDNLAEVFIIHYANDRPVQYEQRWVNVGVAPDFIKQDFSQINASAYLIENLPLQGGSYTIEALSANKEVAEALQLELGSPILVLSRKTWSKQQIITYVIMSHAGNYYRIQGVL